MRPMALCVATMKNDNLPHPGDIPGWVRASQTYIPTYIHRNWPDANDGVVGSYQWMYEGSGEPILCYLHDDVICREEGWDVRLLKEFEDPKVGLVGFGGALAHGSSELYKRPYELTNLRRMGYLSNVDDAEVHGERFSGSCDVAVLDGFCLCIRRSVLDRIGGWKILIDAYIGFIAYDYVICALVRRLGYRIRVVGCRCHHRGGGTSVKINVDRQAEYDYAHRWCYENLRDVLPYKVP